MKTGRLRKAGGATILTIPASLVTEMGLCAGQQVVLRRVDDHIEITPLVPPQHTLDDLLAQCDFSEALSDEDDAWLALPDVGKEASK